jgi:hypothetical protein
MKLKTVMKVIVCLSVALFFLIGTARADKRYQIMISAVTKAAAVELQPGEYTIIVDNSAVRFANSKTGKEFEVAAKIDDSAKTKFAGTEVHSKRFAGPGPQRRIAVSSFPEID